MRKKAWKVNTLVVDQRASCKARQHVKRSSHTGVPSALLAQRACCQARFLLHGSRGWARGLVACRANPTYFYEPNLWQTSYPCMLRCPMRFQRPAKRISGRPSPSEAPAVGPFACAVFRGCAFDRALFINAQQIAHHRLQNSHNLVKRT